MIIKLYLLLLPVTHAFNLSSLFIVPIIISVINALNVLISRKKFFFDTLDKLFIVFLSAVFFSNLVNFDQISYKTINHSLVILSLVFLWYFFIKQKLINVSLANTLRIIYISYLIVISFSLIEFCSINFLGINFDNYIPRPSLTEYNPGFLGLFIRARSFFEESGYYAFYIACIFPLVYFYVLYFLKSKYVLIFLLIYTLLGIFTAFSVTFFLFFPLSIVLFILLKYNFKLLVIRKILYTSLILIILFIVFNQYFISFYESSILSKFAGISFEDRLNKYFLSVDLIMNASMVNLLFGYSAGSYYSLKIDPAISVHINFIRDFGIVGYFSFLFINMYSIVRLILSKVLFAKYLAISLIASNLFFISTPHYFEPQYFLLFALSSVYVFKKGIK